MLCRFPTCRVGSAEAMGAPGRAPPDLGGVGWGACLAWGAGCHWADTQVVTIITDVLKQPESPTGGDQLSKLCSADTHRHRGTHNC